MNVGLLTTWGQSCGIATYSEGLAEALVAGGHRVLPLAPSEPKACMRPTKISAVPHAWIRSDPNMAERLASRLEGLDVLHVQHEHGLHPIADFFLKGIQEINKTVPVVVTLHTLFHPNAWQGTGFLDALCAACSGVIVHTPESAAAMTSRSRKARCLIDLIPHGTPSFAAVPRERARAAAFEVANVPAPVRERENLLVGVVLGFQGPNKNTRCTVRAFSEACARGLIPDAVLIVAGDFGDENFFLGDIRYAINEGGYTGRVFLHAGYISDEVKTFLLRAADFGVVNTTSWTLSASGMSHEYMACAVPIAAANRPIYNEAIQAGAIPYDVREDATSPSLACINAVAALGGSARENSRLRLRVSESMAAYGVQTSWERVARRHVDFYSEVLEHYHAV